MTGLRRFLVVLTATLTAFPVAASSIPLTFREIYSGGADISEAAQSLLGKEVILRGFMTPPLKADADWFILTKMPMASCPF